MHKEQEGRWIKFDFEQARVKHLLFKTRLRSILYGADLDAAPVISHYDCAVGQWIYGHALSAYANIPEMHKLEQVHTTLHTVARKLVDLYKTGKVAEARVGLDEMELISDELVELLSTVETLVHESGQVEFRKPAASDPLVISPEELEELQQLNRELDRRLKEQSRDIFEAKERFELIAKATHDAVWDWNLLTNKMWWNEGFKELFGYAQEEIYPTIDSWYIGLHPEDREWVIQSIHDVIDKGGSQWLAEYRFGRKDGSYATVLDRGYILHNQDGKPYRMLGSMQDITDRKKTEELLIQKDKNFRNIINTAPVAMLIFKGEDLIFDTVNQSMLALIDKTSEIIGKPLLNVLPELKGQPVIDIFRRVYKTGEPYFDYERLVPLMRDALMEERYFKLAFTPVQENGGNVGIMVVATEVTEQVLARMKVEESNKEFKFVTDFMPQIIWSTKADGYHEFYNKRWYDYTGLTYEQSKDTGWNAVLHPDDQEKAWEVWRHSLKTGDPYEIEYRFKRFDGQYRWFLGRALPLKDDGGNIYKWYGTCTDIDDQKKNTDLLEERVVERTRDLESQKSLLDNILTNSSNGISVSEMIRDEEGRVYDARTILANESAVKYVGIPKDIYLNQRARDLDPDIFSSPYGRACLNTLASGEPTIIQHHLGAINKWLELTISRMDENHLIHIFTDVTVNKQSQLELERTIQELKRSNANLEDFAYAASHDLKEPIRKIRTFSERLKNNLGVRLLEKDQHYFQRMEKATERMQLLINDLLEFSHTSNGNTNFEEINLDKKVALVLEDLEVIVAEKNARVIVGPLPVITGHRRQIQQVFQNLITNALKFSRPDIRPEIHITSSVVKGEDIQGDDLHNVSPEKLYNLLKVSDNGIGFEQAYADKIFKMFQRLHGKAEYEGTGIGLAIVRKVIENHKGFIKAESEPGQGATFKIFLPIE
jgi:PAS domain S-box-containing protein